MINTLYEYKHSNNSACGIHLVLSSSYSKILGETNFQPREFPRSGSKAKDGEEREKKKDRKLVLTMASYTLQTPPQVAPGPKERKKSVKTMASIASMEAVWTKREKSALTMASYA